MSVQVSFVDYNRLMCLEERLQLIREQAATVETCHLVSSLEGLEDPTYSAVTTLLDMILREDDL